MKISLAAPSYTSRSVVAAAQQTMNFVPEPVEVGNEPVKMVLYGRPGLKYFTSLVPGKIRCLWAGGGRLFVIHGPTLSEVLQDGSVHDRAGTVAQIAGVSPDPAQIFSNGHQLMIVSGGQVYCDNGGTGGGPVPVKQLESGNGNTSSSGNQLVWIDPATGLPGTGTSGPFLGPPVWSGPIVVNNVAYTITGVPNGHTILLDRDPGNQTNVVFQSPNGGLLDGVTGAFLDGYFIVNRVYNSTTAGSTQPGRQFNISWLNDGTMWDPADFGVKEGAADNIRSVLADHEELWLFGEETTEIWTNIGDPNFPFQRIAGAFIHKGSVATYAPCSAGLSVCWLSGGDDGQTIALRARGLQPERISTYAQENEWNAPGFKVDDAVSYTYSDGGHVYWLVLFWMQQRCFVYDLTTGLWHDRAAWNSATKTYLRYRPWFHVFLPGWGVGGKHIVGDPDTGILYEQSLNYYTDDGSAIEYVRAFPHLINENEYAYHHRLEALVEMGTQAPTDPVPLLGLDWSDDHGHTFDDTVGRLMPMAASGNYMKRAAFRRLGKARDRVYRLGIESKVKIAFIDTYLEMTQGFA